MIDMSRGAVGTTAGANREHAFGRVAWTRPGAPAQHALMASGTIVELTDDVDGEPLSKR